MFMKADGDFFFPPEGFSMVTLQYTVHCTVYESFLYVNASAHEYKGY